MPIPAILVGVAIASAVAGVCNAKKTSDVANEKQQKEEKSINDGEKRVERARVSALKSVGDKYY